MPLSPQENFASPQGELQFSNRADLIERCRFKVARRSAPRVTVADLAHGIPLFLDQLRATLQIEQTSDPVRSREVSGPAGGGSVVSEMESSIYQYNHRNRPYRTMRF